MKSKRGKTYISSGLLLPSKVTHLVIKRPPHFDFHPGDYVFVNIPAIAKYEWHPFTISSAPEQEDYMWLHIRGVGQWTNRLYDYFEKEQDKLHNGNITALVSQGSKKKLSNGAPDNNCNQNTLRKIQATITRRTLSNRDPNKKQVVQLVGFSNEPSQNDNKKKIESELTAASCSNTGTGGALSVQNSSMLYPSQFPPSGRRFILVMCVSCSFSLCRLLLSFIQSYSIYF